MGMDETARHALRQERSCPLLEVRHPPRSGWLDELGRLKGGWAKGLGVARCAALLVSSELSACSIRSFLLADVIADLLQFEPDG